MNEYRDDVTPLIELIRLEVDELTLDHKEHHWQEQYDAAGKRSGRAIVQLPRQALIAQIRAGIYGDLGRTHGGHSLARERGVMDLGAFTVYEDITGRIDAHFVYLTGQHPRETAEATLRAWYVAFNNNYRKNEYSDLVMHRALRELRSWSRRIRSHFDPPRQKELAGPCPVENCGSTEWVGADKVKHTALFVQYRDDEKPEARCRCCGARWEGTITLLNLGYYLGANVDEDTLREMGVVA